MKIHIAGIATETNTFAMAPTGLAAWEVDHGEGRSAEARRWHEAGRRLAARDGHEAHFGLLAAAQPAGTTVQSAYETLRDELLQRLQATLPVNAVLLVLHGAMVAEGFFWLAGQGGYGIQMAPALARAAAALVLGQALPEDIAAQGVTPQALSPQRLTS